MASIHIGKIEFIANNPYGTFVTGDVLDMYIDTDLVVDLSEGVVGSYTGISVNLNGSPLAGTLFSYIITVDPAFVIITNYNVSFCHDTTKIVCSPEYFYPFSKYYHYYDSYDCVINPPTCDILVNGIPDVISASSEIADDGSITINATSSNTLEYKIGSDFVYGDGTGQSSNTFSGLLAGSYRIYIRDAVNCAANILVTVPFGLTFGTEFQLEYDDYNGNVTTLTLEKRSYSGSVTEVCGNGDPFVISLRGEGSENKFEPVQTIEGVMSLRSDTEGQFVTLYTNDPNLYRLRYKKNGDLLWLGKVLPNQYNEQYLKKSENSIIATDALASLKDFFLIQRDGQKYFGTVSLIKLVANILSSIQFNLGIRVAVNLYSTDMDQTDSDDPFDQAYIDYECFYLAKETPDYDFILRSILEPFGARIIQWGGYWNITRVEELVDTYDYREFDEFGDYVSNGSYNPVKELDYRSNFNDTHFLEGTQAISLRPGYGNITVRYLLGLKKNIFDNGDFRLNSQYIPGLNIYSVSINTENWILVNAGYALTENFERIDNFNVAYKIAADESILNNTFGGEAYLQSRIYDVKMGSNNTVKLSLRYKISRLSVVFAGTVYTIDVPYVKVRIRVKYGDQYLQSDGSWSDDENILTFFTAQFDTYNDIEITANQPVSGTPVSGMDFSIRIYHAYAYYAQFQSISSLEGFETYDSGEFTVPTGYKTELRDDFVGTSSIYYYELEENTSAASGYDIIRPDDYHATNNPRQWIKKYVKTVGGISGTNVFPFSIDKVVGKFQISGNDPFDTIVRNTKAEPANRSLLEKELVIGSFSNLITTETNFGLGETRFSLAAGFVTGSPSISIVTTSTLSSDLIYSGYLRDVDGLGYEFWTRDGVAESDKLHGIFLKSYSAQYKRSWRLLQASIKSSGIFNLIDVLKEVNDSDRIYMPVGVSLSDKMCVCRGEFHELINITSGAGSDGTGEAPYSSGFTTGFGSSGFR